MPCEGISTAQRRSDVLRTWRRADALVVQKAKIEVSYTGLALAGRGPTGQVVKQAQRAQVWPYLETANGAWPAARPVKRPMAWDVALCHKAPA